MDEGITEEFRAFGHRYQVQTELVSVDPPRLRTSVFDSGRVVAVRERTVEEGSDFGEALEEHHRRIVDGLRKRAAPEDGGDDDDGRRELSARSGRAPDLETPPVPEDPALVDGLRVRQLYGDLRRRLARIGESAGDRRLDQAESTLRWIVAHPLFPKIRLDEQLRFHRLLDRIAGRGDVEEPVGWSEVSDFVGYLGMINHRQDLVTFDHELLGWLDRSIEARGVDPATLTPMRWIFGRDDALDVLLEEVATTDRTVWLGEIRRVRKRLAEL